MSFWSQDAVATKDPVARPDVEPIQGGLELKVRLHQRLLDILNLGALDATSRETLRTEIRDLS